MAMMDEATEAKSGAEKGGAKVGLEEGIDKAAERRLRRRVIAELAEEDEEPGEEAVRRELLLRRRLRRRILSELLGEDQEPEVWLLRRRLRRGILGDLLGEVEDPGEEEGVAERLIRRRLRRRMLAWLLEGGPVDRLMLRREVAQAAKSAFTPKADIFEQDNTLVIRTELPGLKKGDVDISVDEGDLVIRGERTVEPRIKDEDYFQDETIYGKFYRRISLPEWVKPEQIKADFRDGILDIRIPMPARQKIAVA